MEDLEISEVIYETESVTWESEEEEEAKKEEESKKEKTRTEKNETSDCPGSPEQKPVTLPRVKSLVIPAPRQKSPRQSVGIRAPYRHQIELRAQGRGMLLFESYNEQCCVWQPSKGRLLLYAPRSQEHERAKEWYVHPALRIFPGRAKLHFNLELVSRLKPVFDEKSLVFGDNLLHVMYRPKRQQGVKLLKGILWDIYISKKYGSRITPMQTWEYQGTAQSVKKQAILPLLVQ